MISPLDARIDRGLRDIDQQVEDDEEQRQHQDRALQQRQVTLEDRRIEQQSRARPREYGLDQDRTAEHVAELQAHHRQRSRRRVLDDVLEHVAFAQALGAQRLDKILRKDVAGQRAHGAGDDAHRDHRCGDRRQHEIFHVLPVPAPRARAARTGADRGQPVELHREDDDQHHAEPVMRHGNAGDRERGRELVDPGVAEIAGDQPEQQPEREADQRGGNRQRDRVADRAQHFRQHRATGRDRAAEIAMQRAPEPQAELHRQRPVEAVGGAHLRGEFLRGIGRQHRDQGIAGRDVHQQEAHQRDAEHDRDDVDDAPEGVDEHGLLLCFPSPLVGEGGADDVRAG